MEKIPFNESEIEVVKEVEARGAITRFYNRPITEKENMRRLYYEDYPMWIPAGRASNLNFCPKCIPDNIARAFVYDGSGFDSKANGGGKDMFGIPWVFVPVAGGSMEDPAYGHPLEDVNDWEKVLTFPDINSWDWEQSRKDNVEYLKTDKWVVSYILNGAWFERLISFMGFENAAMALIDEDQQDALKALFAKTTKLYMDIIDKYAEYFPEVDALNIHDDWGSQKSPFFSQEAAMEMIVPFMKQLTDHCKAKGFVADMHSCGHNISRIEAYIAGGWQSWSPQPMNDTEKLFQEYGDKIIISVNLVLPKDLTPEQEADAAKRFVETHCVPGKKLKVNVDTSRYPTFEKEMYKQSRLAYLSM